MVSQSESTEAPPSSLSTFPENSSSSNEPVSINQVESDDNDGPDSYTMAISNLRCPSPPPILANSNNTKYPTVSQLAGALSKAKLEQQEQQQTENTAHSASDSGEARSTPEPEAAQTTDSPAVHTPTTHLQFHTTNLLQKALLQNLGVVSGGPDGRETVVAGGAILNANKGSNTSSVSGSSSAVHSATASPALGGGASATAASSTDPSVILHSLHPPTNKIDEVMTPPVLSQKNSTTSIDTNKEKDSTANSGANPNSPLSSSIHAHFFMEDILKLGKFMNRSRSNSASTLIASEDMLSRRLVLGNPSASGQTGQAAGSSNSNLASPLHAPSPSGNVDSPNPSIPGAGTSTLEQNANIDPRLPTDDGKIHVLVGMCGALSIVKAKMAISKLLEIYGPERISVQVILTQASQTFIGPEALHQLEKKVRIWRDEDEWSTWKQRLDPVLHIELRRWADILVVCPMTANTLSKISLGLCDNLLTNVVRAWNTSKPILLAPAMISYSYNAVTTRRQLRLISEEMPWIEVLKPSEKVIGSYGDIGLGGMTDWNEIVNKIVMKLGGYPDENDDEDEDEEEEDDTSLSKKQDEEDDDDDDDDDEDDEDDDDDEDDEDDENDENEDEKLEQEVPLADKSSKEATSSAPTISSN